MTDEKKALADELVRPNWKTLQPVGRRHAMKDYGAWSVCPICDAYALGIELEVGIPIIDQNGRSRTIHDLMD